MSQRRSSWKTAHGNDAVAQSACVWEDGGDSERKDLYTTTKLPSGLCNSNVLWGSFIDTVYTLPLMYRVEFTDGASETLVSGLVSTPTSVTSICWPGYWVFESDCLTFILR